MLGRVGNEDMGETKVKWNQRSMPPSQKEKMFCGRRERVENCQVIKGRENTGIFLKSCRVPTEARHELRTLFYCSLNPY